MAPSFKLLTIILLRFPAVERMCAAFLIASNERKESYSSAVAVKGFLTMHVKKVWAVTPPFEIYLCARKGMPIKGSNMIVTLAVAPMLEVWFR